MVVSGGGFAQVRVQRTGVDDPYWAGNSWQNSRFARSCSHCFIREDLGICCFHPWSPVWHASSSTNAFRSCSKHDQVTLLQPGWGGSQRWLGFSHQGCNRQDGVPHANCRVPGYPRVLRSGPSKFLSHHGWQRYQVRGPTFCFARLLQLHSCGCHRSPFACQAESRASYILSAWRRPTHDGPCAWDLSQESYIGIAPQLSFWNIERRI